MSDQALAQLDRFRDPVGGRQRRLRPWRCPLARPACRSGHQRRHASGADRPAVGGQAARLALLRLRLERPNLYLLDEPTNHLDIDGQEALEAELLERQATLLLVSHDRAFVRAVANRIWVIDAGRLVEVEDAGPVFDRLMDS